MYATHRKRFATPIHLIRFVAKHLKKQGKQAADDENCQYRTQEGLMCAVGCLIPDELYTSNIEGSTVDLNESNNRILQITLKQLGFRKKDYTLLRKLQLIHDIIEIKDWSKNLNTLRKSYEGKEW